MRLDIRKPIGWVLLLSGVQLAGYGAMADAAEFKRSLGVNVDLYWGVVLIAAGALFLALARRGAAKS